jgi:mono/diheme cytochrome c family protein
VTDFGALYREHVAHVSAMAGELSEEQLALVVPATPLWTVRQVLCHMAGGADDQLTGRMDGAPSPDWTARHVRERVDLPVPEVIGELQANQESVAASLEGSPFPAAAFDISVHHADLHEALGPSRLADHLWLPVLDAMRPRLDPSLFESASDYEVYRGAFSRRSRAQMQAWGTTLSADELDGMTIFGPREDDQPIPAQPQ